MRSPAYAALFAPATVLTAGQQLTAPARAWAHYAAPYHLPAAVLAGGWVPVAAGRAPRAAG